MYSIVTNYKIVSEFKKCRYFKTNLGISSTIDKGGNRILNEKDKFGYFYNNQYRTTILGQGNIGDIKIYCDHYIKEDMIAVYHDIEEFTFDVDFKLLHEKGIDFYLGHILKEVESQYEERVKLNIEKKMEEKKKGNPDIVSLNPGSVTYEDLKAYLEQQSKNRYS